MRMIPMDTTRNIVMIHPEGGMLIHVLLLLIMIFRNHIIHIQFGIIVVRWFGIDIGSSRVGGVVSMVPNR